MTDIPTTARGFEHWFHHSCDWWPKKLRVLGQRALLSLQAMDQTAHAQSEVLQSAAKKDLQAFVDTYTEWKR